MKTLLSTILLTGLIYSQVSLSDINKIGNDQLDAIRSELKKNEENFDKETILKNRDNEPQQIEVLVDEDKNKVEDKFFGYNYFKRDISFFDNIPAPSGFKLGPGDEIILSLWGENNLRQSLVINKQGLIYFENIGFVNLSNRTLEEAEEILKSELSKIYSTLNNIDNKTSLMLELGKLKSINVYFSGQIENPGVNLIHPFSDPFSAIVQVGGINKKGSLRDVQLVRDNKVIKNIDFYSFFTSGVDNFSSLRIIEGDIIHIPEVSNRVEVSGAVTTEGFFELKENETITNLIDYLGGLSANASSFINIDTIIPISERLSDDNARTSKTVKFNDYSSYILNNGDVLNFLSIPIVESKVEIFGKVKSPGLYPSSSDLKSILDFAGGFSDPIFRNSIDNKIIILRKNKDNFYAEEISINYEDSAGFKLFPEDKIFVYENINYRNSFTFTISGEVMKPGTYPLVDGLTVQGALNLAGGLTQLGSTSTIIASKPFKSVSEGGEIITENRQVGNLQVNFKISNDLIITVLPIENVIKVEGNVYNPGLIALEKRVSMYDAIELAGGYKPYSLKKKSYVLRANGEIERANILRGRAKRVYPGDTIIVPVDPNPQDFDITTFVADLSTTLANIAAILLIADNNN